MKATPMKCLLLMMASLLLVTRQESTFVFGFSIVVPRTTFTVSQQQRQQLQSTQSQFTARKATKVFQSSPTNNKNDVAGEDDTEEEGLDLNLEEMFTMFDAADKDVDFDTAIQKVKNEK
jgi:hypothetical protein